MTAPTTKRGRAGKAVARRMWMAGDAVFLLKTEAEEEALNLRLFHAGDAGAQAFPVAILSMTPEAQKERVEAAARELGMRTSYMSKDDQDPYRDAARHVLRKLGVVK